MIKISRMRLIDKNKDNGFSLIEVVIAICVFAIGFLAVASMQVSASKSNRMASEITVAVNLASDQMEQLMSLAYDDADLDPAANPHLDNQGKYDIQWIVTDTDLNTDGFDDARIINLTVSWTAFLNGGSTQRDVNIDFVKPDI